MPDSTTFKTIASMLLLVIFGTGMASHANALDVRVTGLKSSKGNVVVCLWKRAGAGFPDCAGRKPFRKIVVPAGKPTVTFPNLAPGDYALTMFHDAKRLGRPETNFLGMPKSAVGSSNNPSGMPSFEKSRFSAPGTKTIVIKAKYLF